MLYFAECKRSSPRRRAALCGVLFSVCCCNAALCWSLAAAIYGQFRPKIITKLLNLNVHNAAKHIVWKFNCLLPAWRSEGFSLWLSEQSPPLLFSSAVFHNPWWIYFVVFRSLQGNTTLLKTYSTPESVSQICSSVNHAKIHHGRAFALACGTLNSISSGVTSQPVVYCRSLN